MTEVRPMQILSEAECWARLEATEFGRMAYHLADEVHIAPVNYAVTDRRLVFRTAEGSKLLGVVMNGMNLLGVSAYYQQGVQGIILVLAAGLCAHAQTVVVQAGQLLDRPGSAARGAA